MPADLTSLPLFDIIPFGYSEEEEEYPFRLCKENPWFGEKGRGQNGEYPLELAPQRRLPSRRAPGAPVTALSCDGTT